MSILLTFDVTGNTYEENVVQYKFWYSFLFILMAIALISSVIRYFNLVNNFFVNTRVNFKVFWRNSIYNIYDFFIAIGINC